MNPADLPPNLRAKVDVTDAGCWQYQRPLTGKGYARVRVNGKLIRAHRLAYEALVGPIPAGLHLDHLCRNRACINPGHLEPVTNHQNALRGVEATKTECLRGHPLHGENLRWRYRPDGRKARVCRRCAAIRNDRKAA